MLDPQLQRTGPDYASRNEPSGNGVYQTGAMLDVVRGRNAAAPLAGPVTFPRDGGTVVARSEATAADGGGVRTRLCSVLAPAVF